MKKILICILCLSMLFLSGCDMIRGIIPSDEPGVPDDIPKVDGRVSIESEDLYLFVNQSAQLSVSTYEIEAPTVDWKSSDEAVVSVKDGRVTSMSIGYADITAAVGDASDTVRVSVIGSATKEEVNSFDERYINIFGRYSIHDGELVLDHTANAVEIGLFSDSLTLDVRTNNVSYMRIYVDGVEYGDRITIIPDITRYTVVNNLGEGYHVVRIVKVTEMQYSEWTVSSFEAESFATVPEKSGLKIEFIGDSITSGYGALGSYGQAWSIENSDVTGSYSYMTADLLGADYSVVSWSGICVRAEYWSSTHMTNLYERQSFRDYTPYEFNNDTDVVVLNLGTNDSWYILNENKGYEKDFWNDYLTLLNNIRRKNPDAYIICLYGMMGVNPNVDEGIRMAVSIFADPKVVYNPIEIIPNGNGANGHPTKDAQHGWAELLSDYVKTLEI